MIVICWSIDLFVRNKGDSTKTLKQILSSMIVQLLPHNLKKMYMRLRKLNYKPLLWNKKNHPHPHIGKTAMSKHLHTCTCWLSRQFQLLPASRPSLAGLLSISRALEVEDLMWSLKDLWSSSSLIERDITYVSPLLTHLFLSCLIFGERSHLSS